MKINWPFAARPKKLTAETATPQPTHTRPGFFSTEIEMPDLLEQAGRDKQRRVNALRQTFQRGFENLVAVTTATDSTPGEAITDIGHAMDEAYPELTAAKLINSTGGGLPVAQLEWYGGQGFIGWQTCAILSQNWLVDKACRMPGDDAIRHGWEITANDGGKLSPKDLAILKRVDKKIKIKKQLREYVKNGRIFGIRHAMFVVDGIDYELPFNPDGVKPGSYKGITQIDPYWLAPMLDRSAAANPASMDFYEPTWWMVNGKRVHKSHFVIMRNGDEVADILKPSYMYGGIPIPQKIYERVYAAERTANEAPMLAMSKRLTCVKLDLSQAGANPEKLQAKMALWSAIMNNFGIKVIGDGEDIQQFDTNLTGLDETIMTQYQIVAAASNVPATKLLGTSPKGFNSTGEAEEANYHEELESIQELELTPFLDRHYLLAKLSYAPTITSELEISWKPVDSPTAEELADLNLKKAQTGQALVNSGAIDGFDERQRISKDPDSGYSGIPDVVPGGPGDREAQMNDDDGVLEGAVQAKPARADGGGDE